MKKKIFSLLLAMAVVLSLGVTAFATDYTASEATSFNITKTYTSDESFVPGETLSFNVTADTDPANPSSEMIVVGTNNTYTITDTTTTSFSIPVTVPSYSTAGVYNYTITESEGVTAGVSYDTTKTIDVAVLVEINNDTDSLEVTQTSYIVKDANGNKVDTFENSFDTGTFTVAKKVTGNQANKNDTFTVDYVLTSSEEILTTITVGGTEIPASAWTQNGTQYTYSGSITVSESNGAVTFDDIPVKVTATITEDSDSLGNYTLVGYAVDGGNSSTTAPTLTVGDTAQAVVITNNYGTTVNTGITLDNLPYVLILAAVAVCLVVFFTKKRTSKEK